jgi:anti-sigma-K factor RskA
MSPKAPEPVFEDGIERPLAAELVLGLVQDEEREALLLRLRDDPVFADEVSFWETRFSPLIDRIEPVKPPEHVWAGIADHIHPPTVPVATLRAAPRNGLWHSLPVWRGIGFAASGLAAACLALLLLSTPLAPPKTMVAMLNLEDGRSAFMVTVDKSAGRIVLMPAADSPAPPQHTHELWLIPAGGSPVSLGTFVAKGPVTLPMPDTVMPQTRANGVLAISVEPMGGSPTGQPTGPVVAKGAMHNV